MIDRKFKKGDRVRLICGCDEFKLNPGDTGTVNENFRFRPFVLWDRPECNGTIHGTAIYEDLLNLIS